MTGISYRNSKQRHRGIHRPWGWPRPRACKQCGRQFFTRRGGIHLAKWCSNACRQRAYRDRRLARVLLEMRNAAGC